MINIFRISVPTGSSTTAIALKSGSVAVELRQIPNQPIQFKVFISYKSIQYLSRIIFFNIKVGSIVSTMAEFGTHTFFFSAIC
jgi:hypothetical protein